MTLEASAFRSLRLMQAIAAALARRLACARHFAFHGLLGLVLVSCGGSAGQTGLQPSPSIEPGCFTVHVPSTAAGAEGVAVRVFHPGTGACRYPEGAPIAVFVPGGHSPGLIPPVSTDEDVSVHGFIKMHFLLPGGEAADARSGGAYDYRGPNCRRALADVILYARGARTDTEGMRLQDRLPFALPDNVGVIGSSNGGNLALTAFAAHGGELGRLAWFAAWESPIGDQAVVSELSMQDGTLNTYYVPGTSSVTSCPWDGLGQALAFDADAAFELEDPATGKRISLKGRLFLDEDRDGALDADEFVFSPLGGPGEVIGGSYKSKAYTSEELAQVLDARSGSLFPGGAPAWLATRSEVAAYWSERDGSWAFADAHAALPDMLVMSLGSVVDHVQRQPDHFHVRSHQRGWLEAGHAFVRLNPDASYMAQVTGKDAARFPDNHANQEAPYPGIESTLEPEKVDGQPIDPALTVAALLELSDRARAGDRSTDLGAVLE